jgi:hypothetical protein
MFVGYFGLNNALPRIVGIDTTASTSYISAFKFAVAVLFCLACGGDRKRKRLVGCALMGFDGL